MKNNLRALATLLTFILVISCNEKPVPPVFSTTPAIAITTTTAVSGGEVTDDGGAALIA